MGFGSEFKRLDGVWIASSELVGLFIVLIQTALEPAA